MSSNTRDCSLTVRVDIAILAHNEAEMLPLMLADLMQQTALYDPALDLRIMVLANGCQDDTVEVARRSLDERPPDVRADIRIEDFEAPGKSRTMNRFLRTLLRPDATLVAFMDGDIRLPRTDTLARMVAEMTKRPDLRVFVSRPIKDVVYHETPLSFVAGMIAAGSEGLTDYRRSIAGSLFMMRASLAQDLSLPAGLPVEDGFIRAMVLTDFLSAPEDLSWIDGHEDVFHLYEAVQTVGALVRHQARLVLGGAVNAAIFAYLERTTEGRKEEVVAILSEASADPDWLGRILTRELPKAHYGYVPLRFLTKRLKRANVSILLRPKRLAMLAIGLGLDFVSYIVASFYMASGKAAGHW